MISPQRLPYPGLRAFNRDESDLFFGRETCIDEMLNKLAQTRFLAILGTSGSGKSSLVRTGLFDALELGFMSGAGSRWKIIDTHPGDQALKNLATGLMADDNDPLGIDLLSSFLTRGPRSLIEWCKDGHLQPGWNLLILVDQFEELFRYSNYAAREEAEAFAALLLESAAADLPIYVAITMRSEYLSACTLIPGLTERINAGLYLTPRMSRDQCRAAIEGPAGVIGFTVEPALVNRLLNDLEEFSSWEEDKNADQLQRLSRRADQLPLMQHVLNRLWLQATDLGRNKPSPEGEGWVRGNQNKENALLNPPHPNLLPQGEGVRTLNPTELSNTANQATVLTLADYNTIGGLQHALNDHAQQVIAPLSGQQQSVMATVFRALVDGASIALAVRRPCSFGELVDLTGDKDAVTAVVNAFRSADCNFLRPAATEALHDKTIIDLSHESLIRQWQDLKNWTEQEAESVAIYRRLEQTALLHKKGKTNFHLAPEFENVLAWQEKYHPTENWAKRYGQHFDRAMAFLAASVQEKKDELEKERLAQQREIDQLAKQRELEQQAQQREIEQAKLKARWALGGFVVVLVLSIWAVTERYHAQNTEQQRVVELFQSRLTHASLLAKGEDYAGAKKVLAETDALDDQVPPSLRHARNLLHSFSQIKGGGAEQVYTGAGYPLFTVAISPDGQLLAAGGEHGTLVVFDAHSGKLLQRLSGHAAEGEWMDNAVYSVAFSPNGQQLISAGAANKKIIVWQRQPGGLTAAAPTDPAGVQAPPASLKAKPSSPPVATVHDLTIFTQQQQLNAADKIKAIGISPDGKLLASGGDGSSIALWELSSGKQLNTLSGHTDGISPKGLAFSPDGRYLASGSWDNTAIIWRLATGKAEQVLTGHTAQVNSLSFSADSARLATGSSDKTLHLWNVATGQMQQQFNGHSNTVWAVSWLGDYLLSGSDDRSIRLWDSRSGVVLRVWQGHEAGVEALALHGREAWSASNDGTARRWALTLPFQQALALPTEPASAAIMPSLSHVAVGFANGALALYGLQAPEPVWQKPAAHSDKIARLTVNHDGSLLVSGSFDHAAKLWQVQASATGLTLQESLSFSGHTDAIHALAFSPDDLTLATAGYDGQIGLFSVGQDQPAAFIKAAHEGRVMSVEFDPTGKQLVSSGYEDHSLKLWDLQTKPPTSQNFPLAKDSLLWAGISPDGQKLVSVGREQSVDVYDRRSTQLLYHLTGHENAIYRAVFAPDSGQLATVSNDRTVRFWNLDQGKELFSLALPTTTMGNSSSVWDFDFRCLKDQCLVAVPLVRGTLQLYRLGYEQELTEDSDEQKRQQLELWRQYQNTADQQLRTNALQPAEQTLREAGQIAQRLKNQFPNDSEITTLKIPNDCQQQQLQILQKPDSPALSPACEISLNHATTADRLNRLAVSFYHQKQYPKAQALFAEALNKFPEELYLLGNDAELALVQDDKPRLQQRLSALQALYRQKDGVYSDEIPAIMSFLMYLSAPEQAPEAVLKVIGQTDKAVSYGWDSSDIQPVLKRQNSKRQKTAALFIDFFQQRIGLDALKSKLNTR